MQMINLKKIIGHYFILGISSICFFYSPYSASSENLIGKAPGSEYLKKNINNNFYILGTGDSIEIKFPDSISEELSINSEVDAEGLLYLKRLGKVYVKGLTIEELKNILVEEYSNYLKNPDLEINITKYRPVKVFIDGEIENPGLLIMDGNYIIDQNITAREDSSDEKPFKINSSVSLYSYPTVFEAIKKSGGILNSADLTNIEIVRINSISEGSGKIKTKINLIKAIDLDDPGQNIRILDGDTIFIPKSSSSSISQINKAIRSNLNPKFIQVYVSGRVNEPGYKKVSKAATLIDAIQISGGAKVLKGPVMFIRYENNGKIDKRKFSYNRSAKRGSYKNPLLNDGDLIFIGKGALNTTTEVINEISAPFSGIVSTYGFYKILTE